MITFDNPQLNWNGTARLLGAQFQGRAIYVHPGIHNHDPDHTNVGIAISCMLSSDDHSNLTKLLTDCDLGCTFSI